MPVRLEPVLPKEAIAAFRRRGRRFDPTFSYLDAYAEEHAAMLTVAKSTGFDILDDIEKALREALEEGKTFREFADELEPLLRQKGWWGRQLLIDPQTGEQKVAQLGSPRRLRTIFETNMRVSYAAGAWANFERNKAVRPFLRYVAILDERTRPGHRRMHNLVLPVDHPFWQEWAPPNGWNCRCTLMSLSQRDVDKLLADGEPLQFEPPDISVRDWTNKRTGEVRSLPDGIDPGWDYNAGEAGHKETVRRVQEKHPRQRELFPDLPPSSAPWPEPPTTEAAASALVADFAEATQDWRNGLSDYETDTLARYKASDYRLINAIQRNRLDVLDFEPTQAQIDVAVARAKTLDDALRQVAIPRRLVTFRGLATSDRARLANWRVGTTYRDNGFVSSSLLPDVAGKFGGGQLIEIRIPSGTPGAIVHDIPTVNLVEFEVLLPAGTRFQVVESSADRIILEVVP